MLTGGGDMGESGNTKHKIIGRIVRLAQAPITRALQKMRERRRSAARKSIWKDVVADVVRPKNRRLLDISTIALDGCYEVGVNAIDNKHKLIMITYNNLVNDAMKLRRSRSKAKKLAERLKPLIVALGEHFSEEEEIMFQEDYPGLFRHISQHDQCMRDILMISDEIENESAEFEQLIFYIGAWLAGHILISDKSFGDFHVRRLIDAEPSNKNDPESEGAEQPSQPPERAPPGL